MDEAAFRQHLRRNGREDGVIDRTVACVRQFGAFLQARGSGGLDAATPADVAAFAADVESTPRASAKGHMQALAYYYDFTGNDVLAGQAAAARRDRIKPAPFRLRAFVGVDAAHVEALAAIGIVHAGQLLTAGRTADDRRQLARQTGVPPAALEELVGLSDLARLPGVKGIRARLYYDCGVRGVANLASYEPAALLALTSEFVTRTGFAGIAPLPKEVESTIAAARLLPIVVEE